MLRQVHDLRHGFISLWIVDKRHSSQGGGEPRRFVLFGESGIASASHGRCVKSRPVVSAAGRGASQDALTA
jgi:hypothetical protein